MDDLLTAGLAALRQSDADIERLLAGRSSQALSLLNAYIEEIERFNPAYGLVAVKDRRELVLKHILDSLAPLGIIARLLDGSLQGGRLIAGSAEAASASIENPAGSAPPLIADVGSGAGLPGIPLAIALPEARFTLIERMGRRVGFLQNTQAILGLENTMVEEGEMEKALPGRFDLVVFRAFRPLTEPILRGLLRLLRTGGCLAAYKGRQAAIEAEMRAAGDLAGAWEALPCPVPFLDEERRLVLIRG
jgi:16S rRNA (guanine527-N7)-methyltransferase